MQALLNNSCDNKEEPSIPMEKTHNISLGKYVGVVVNDIWKILYKVLLFAKMDLYNISYCTMQPLLCKASHEMESPTAVVKSTITKSTKAASSQQDDGMKKTLYNKTIITFHNVVNVEWCIYGIYMYITLIAETECTSEAETHKKKKKKGPKKKPY